MSTKPHRCRAENCRRAAKHVYTLPGDVRVGLCGRHARYLETGMVPPLKPHKKPEA